MPVSPILKIDVAHPPQHPDEVEAQLLDAWLQVKNSAGLRLLKVVHGHGSSGKGGSTRDVVRNWAFRNRTKFRTILEGEQYSLHDASTQEIRKTIGDFDDSDLNAANPGITIIWIK
ncbi:MAG: hypothetical protein HY708_02885 [Ignavibacteriae bacterium]|nr:hypothetical protein [Ignavibacteriota bacterium]